MKRKIVGIGNSMTVCIPPAYLELLGLNKSDTVGLTMEDNKIILYKIKPYCTQNDGLCKTCPLPGKLGISDGDCINTDKI